MTDHATLEKALQATLEELVENRLVSLRRELTEALQEQILAAIASSAGSTAPIVTTAPSTSSGVPEVNQAVARILHPTGQTEIMGAFLQGAAEFSGRCALFVRRGDTFAFWRAEGFRDDIVAALRSATVEPSGVFKDILDTQRSTTVLRAPSAVPAALEQALGEAADGTICVAPIVVQGRVVAALYADAGTVAGSLEPSALEILGMVTGLSLETAASRAAARPSPAVATRAANVTEQPQPITAGSAEPAPAPAPAPPPAMAQAPPGSFAASIPVIPITAPSVEPPPDAESLPESDREAHRKAHRFARVAVQDLLSYHKNKIEQGRKNRNLYALLKDDIEKTRENYRQRFGNTAARSYDYLHYELVLKLAGNDPESLGATYPGAMQEK
ncbi:MAG: hypothetical protein HYX72_06065 [Acidobacteria bacterium]|nr:hypothetical protein [Acidobacteriota bacterium]